MPTRWVTFTMDKIRHLPKRASCVYALYEGARLVYVGQTVNIFNRFATGHRYTRTITHAKAKGVHPDNLDRIERRLIQRLDPDRNQNFTGRRRRYGVQG